MSDSQRKFQQLLRELFQFDCADLDFGIYRIMNHKREAIERFIARDLPRAISEELNQGTLAAQSQAARELEAARKKVVEALGNDALDAEGHLAEQYRNTPTGKAYLEAQERARFAQSREAIETAIYNHLYAFFSRYWQVSKRRYSRKERYAIPYNGKGEKRFFLPRLRDIAWDAEAKVLTIPFEFRPLTPQEQITYGQKNQQDAIIANAVKDIPQRLTSARSAGNADVSSAVDAGAAVVSSAMDALAALTAQKRKTDQGETVTLLEHHLRQYTRRNTRDFFIHKDLKGFLSRELDFYLKNEVLNLDELEAAGEALSEGWFQLMRLIKRIGTAIIEFLAQIEDFQKMLWEKKKFVTETFYIITVGNIPEAFYAEIAACEAQWEEWKQMGFVNLADAGNAGVPSAPPGNADVSSAPPGNAGVPSAPPENADVPSAPPGNAGVPSAPPGNADVPSAPPGNADVPSAPPGNAGVPSAPPGNADVPSAPSGNADVPSAPPGNAGVLSAPPGNADVPSAPESHKGWYARGHLPHFDAAHTCQFITFRLHDSVPAEVIAQWKDELRWTEQTRPDSKEAIELRKRVEQYEDSGHGACYLRDERIAALVEQALKHFDGERYHLIAWCIMPNHVHVLIQQREGHPLSKVIQSWKSFTAHKANKLLGRSGDFWMPDYVDRFIRDEKHFMATVEYIHHNPVKAGLVSAPEEWRWSSAACGGASAGNAGNASVSDAQSVGQAGNTSVSDAFGRRDAQQRGRDVRDPGDAQQRGRDRGRDVRDPGDPVNPRVAFLKAHPTLPLDTRHFPPEFVDRLLASYDNLDEMTDGLLIHSENWQALNLLQEKYRERVKCVYIDPPYNTGSDEFIYRDGYQHASWISMLDNRTRAVRPLMGTDAAIFTSIDDREQTHLRKLYERVFGDENFVANIIWQKKYSPQNDARWLSDNHDFVLCFARHKESWKPGLLPRTEEQDARYQNLDNDPRGPWKPSGLDVKTYAAEYDYEIVTPSGRVVRPPKGRCWVISKERFQELVADNRIWFGPNGDNVPAIKRFLSEVKQGVTPLTLWTYQEVGHNQEGAQELKAMMRAGDVYFTSPKPTRLLKRILTIGSDRQSIVLDYFAGSGTTGHAVINLNREDASINSAQAARRRFILVEMADYFDTVLLPRLKKVTFSPEWKDGQPKRAATQEEFERGPRIIKVIRLESYEDALNNLSFDAEGAQMALQFEDYLLQYMLKWETRHSETLLNVEQLSKPFDYCLHLHRDGETRAQKVDLPETFNYLIGLDVETRRVYAGNASVPDAHGGRDGRAPRYVVYRGVTREGQRAVVIWRETEGWTEEDYQRDRDFVAAQKLTEGADVVYVNGDSLIPGARALEGVFKASMFAGVEA